MTRGEIIGICGLIGMVMSVLCLESAMIPAVIAFGICSIVSFGGHLIADEGFIEKTEDTDKIARNRERVWKNWITESEVKKK